MRAEANALNRNVLVVGAGIAGLTAALELAEAGISVTIADPSPGGMLRTSRFAGRLVDEAADAFLMRSPEAMALARRVGLAEQLVHPASREASVWSPEGPVRLPKNILGVPIDSVEVEKRGLLDAAALSALLRESPVEVDATLSRSGDTSIGDRLSQEIGRGAFNTFCAPLIAAISAGDPNRLSLAAVTPQFASALDQAAAQNLSLVETLRNQHLRTEFTSGEGEPLGPPPIFASPRGGIARLPEAVLAAALATGLVTHRNLAVQAVDRGGLVTFIGGLSEQFNGLIFATPAHVAARLLHELSPQASILLSSIEHVSVAFVRVSIPTEAFAVPLSGSGCVFGPDSGFTITACSWASNKWAHLGAKLGDQTEIIRAAVGRDGDQRHVAMSDDEIAEVAVTELRRIANFSGPASEVTVHRWPNAFPQYRPGHLELVAKIEAELASSPLPLAVAGMFLRGIGIPATITSALTAAQTLIRKSCA